MLDNLPRGIICIEDIETGMSRHIQKVATDHNPVHLDDAYAKDTIFEGSIALAC